MEVSTYEAFSLKNNDSWVNPQKWDSSVELNKYTITINLTTTLITLRSHYFFVWSIGIRNGFKGLWNVIISTPEYQVTTCKIIEMNKELVRFWKHKFYRINYWVLWKLCRTIKILGETLEKSNLHGRMKKNILQMSWYRVSIILMIV